MLSNEYLLITGASSGIGQKCATYLSKHYKLVLSGRDEKALQETRECCVESDSHLIFISDLADSQSIEKDLSDFILKNNIRIKAFVHSAGVLTMLPLKSVELDNIQRDFNVNVLSPALIVKTLINKRKNNTSLNNVVFISSNISNRGARAFSIYGSTKSALDGLMRNLAIELAPKIRVNSVLPGPILTKMTDNIIADIDASCEFDNKIGKAEDIAYAVEFLLSERSRWITGQQITVDGGRTIDLSGI